MKLYHAYICFKLGFNQTTIHADLSTILGDQLPSFKLVTRWVAYFYKERKAVKDKGENFRLNWFVALY